jgi:heme/copper-type cytochrome/quinol oxidase subunit 2
LHVPGKSEKFNVRTRLFWIGGLLVILAAAAVAFAPLPSKDGQHPSTRLIRVEASQFSYSPSVISVNPGDIVTLQLTSKDVVHGLYVDGYGVSVQADPGQTSTLTFVANRSGSFRIRCNITCGAMHPFMIGKLNVGRNVSFVRSAGLALIGVVGLALFAAPVAREAKRQ